jgi:hypothetical protein
VRHRKRRLQQFFVAAGTSLPSCYVATIKGYTDRPTDTHTDGRVYEVCRSDGLICHGIHTKFHKDCFRHSNVDDEGYADTQIGWRSLKPTLRTQAVVLLILHFPEMLK